MTVANQPPANGFTRFMRRTMAVLCMFSFFGLLIAQVTGYLKQDVPAWAFGMLFAGALMQFDTINELAKKVFGGK